MKQTQNKSYLVPAFVAMLGMAAVPVQAYSGLTAVPAHTPAKADLLVKIADTDKAEIDKDKIARGAKNFIDNLASRALSFLDNGDLDQEQLREKFRVLLNESFDINTLARFALGRYWRVASEEQRKAYVDLFRKMIIEVYSGRFGDYEGQRFVLNNARMASDSDAIVTSKVLPPEGEGGQTIKIEWRVRYKNSSYKIVDVTVEGVSMSLTKRSDFSAVIQRGGGDVSVLLAHLREKYGEDSDTDGKDAPKPTQKRSRAQ